MRRLALGAAAVFLIGCGALPTATLRDAQVLPRRAFTFEGAAGFSGLDCYYCVSESEHRQDDPPEFGSVHLDGSLRMGLGEGREQAFRMGFAGTGLYGGYERAYQLAEARFGGIVGYFGGVAGGQEYGNQFLPFVQPYAGLVLGVLDLPIRPELALRVAGQTGLYQKEEGRFLYRGYGLSFISAEPRVRLSMLGLDAYLGMTLGYGYNKCPDCYFSNRAEEVTVAGGTLGVSIDFPAGQAKPYESGDSVRWWNFTEFLGGL